MALPSIAVTGSTGFVGGHAAHLLADAGLPLRLVVRDVSRAPDLAGSVVLEAAYSEYDKAVDALDGVETLLMISAGETENRLDEHKAFIDAASEAGVEHIVYTSFVGAAPDATFTLGRDHRATEEYLETSGIDYTFLRDNLYSDFMQFMVGDDGAIRGPAGDGRAALVTRADVARVASVVLLNPAAHIGATYNLTGPEALSMTDVAAILSAHGKPATFHNETIDEAYESRRVFNAPPWQVDAWVSTYTSIANGDVAAVSDDVEKLTGRKAQSLADFLTTS